jgi:hypothetical protein
MIITLDPSINDCGYAIFRKNRSLHSYGVIKPEKGLEWKEKAYSILLKIESLKAYCNEDLEKIIYEMPEIWFSARGQISKESGALEKLYFVCGMIQGKFEYIAYPLTPSQWKGQLPKDVTLERICKKYHLKDITSHEADAIAIGDYVLINDYILKECI